MQNAVFGGMQSTLMYGNIGMFGMVRNLGVVPNMQNFRAVVPNAAKGSGGGSQTFNAILLFLCLTCQCMTKLSIEYKIA